MDQHHPCFSVEFSRELPPLTTDSPRATQRPNFMLALQWCLFWPEKKKPFPALPALQKQAEGCDYPSEPQLSVWDVVVPPGAEKTTQRLSHLDGGRVVRMCVWLRQSNSQNGSKNKVTSQGIETLIPVQLRALLLHGRVYRLMVVLVKAWFSLIP